MLGLKLNHVSKTGPWLTDPIEIKFDKETMMISREKSYFVSDNICVFIWTSLFLQSVGIMSALAEVVVTLHEGGKGVVA